MQYIFGKTDKTDKKIDNDITDIFKQQLKKQFCQLCSKQPATKVAFGKQIKPVFTCANCELTAVGGSVQKLGPKTLISNEKFAEILTKELISYQNNTKTPPAEHKKPIENCENLKLKIQQLTVKITEEHKKIKKNVKEKHDQLLAESTQQNIIPIFEDVSKLYKEKKLQQIQEGRLLLKRSMCNQKGLCFTNEEAIESANGSIHEKFTNLRKQSKIKLKPIEDLIDEINNIEL